MLASFRIVKKHLNLPSSTFYRVPYNIPYKILSDASNNNNDETKDEDSVLGQKSHIPAPVIEKPEFSPITQLGIKQTQETQEEEVITRLGEELEKKEEDEIITHLGTRPLPKTTPIEEIKKEEQITPMIGDLMDIAEMPYDLLPKFIHKPKLPRLSLNDAVNIPDTLSKIIEESRAKYDETIEAHFNLKVDPRKSDQLVRGIAALPHGTGKKIKIAVFAENEDLSIAKKAGADIVGGLELIDQIILTKGKRIKEMDKCIATPGMMKHLFKIGKILGPKGLMPNPKMGTLTDNVTESINNLKTGKIEFKVDRGGVLHVPFGKISFGKDKLKENFEVLGTSVLQCRPKNIKGKGHSAYISKIILCSTIGRGFPITLPDFVSLVQEHRKFKYSQN